MKLKFEDAILNRDYCAENIVNEFHRQPQDWRVAMLAQLRRIFCFACGYERHPQSKSCPCGEN